MGSRVSNSSSSSCSCSFCCAVGTEQLTSAVGKLIPKCVSVCSQWIHELYSTRVDFFLGRAVTRKEREEEKWYYTPHSAMVTDSLSDPTLLPRCCYCGGGWIGVVIPINTHYPSSSPLYTAAMRIDSIRLHLKARQCETLAGKGIGYPNSALELLYIIFDIYESWRTDSLLINRIRTQYGERERKKESCYFGGIHLPTRCGCT